MATNQISQKPDFLCNISFSLSTLLPLHEALVCGAPNTEDGSPTRDTRQPRYLLIFRATSSKWDKLPGRLTSEERGSNPALEHADSQERAEQEIEQERRYRRRDQ